MLLVDTQYLSRYQLWCLWLWFLVFLPSERNKTSDANKDLQESWLAEIKYAEGETIQ